MKQGQKFDLRQREVSSYVIIKTKNFNTSSQSLFSNVNNIIVSDVFKGVVDIRHNVDNMTFVFRLVQNKP